MKYNDFKKKNYICNEYGRLNFPFSDDVAGRYDKQRENKFYADVLENSIRLW